MVHHLKKSPEEHPKKVRSLTDKQIERLKTHLHMPRFVFKENLSENILFSDEKTPLTCISTDIAKFGLSIVTRVKLDSDMTFFIRFPKFDTSYKLMVIWCEPNQFNPDIFHSGLELCEHNENLMLLCVKAGLLKQKQPSSDQNKIPVDYYKIRENLSKLHAYDKGLLAKVGYKTLVHTHTSYSIRIDNQSFVVVMPSNMQPREFLDLDAYEAAKKTFIVAEESIDFIRKQWVKVWPGYGLLNERISAELCKPRADELPTLSSIKEENNTTDSAGDDLDTEFEVEVS